MSLQSLFADVHIRCSSFFASEHISRNIISGPTRTAPRQAPEGSYFMHDDITCNLSRILLISNASLANRFGSSAATRFHNLFVPFSNMIRRHYTPSYAHVVPRGYSSVYHNVYNDPSARPQTAFLKPLGKHLAAIWEAFGKHLGA